MMIFGPKYYTYNDSVILGPYAYTILLGYLYPQGPVQCSSKLQGAASTVNKQKGALWYCKLPW